MLPKDPSKCLKNLLTFGQIICKNLGLAAGCEYPHVGNIYIYMCVYVKMEYLKMKRFISMSH